ncbi:MAG: HAMP domain-containing sensor histidine kinase [Chloroflexota bacterium]
MLTILMNRILQTRNVAYAITDKSLTLTDLQGTVSILYAPQDTNLPQSIYDLVPEMVGQEFILTELLKGDLSEFELRLINRVTPTGETTYVNVTILPHIDQQQINGLLVFAEDTTQTGQSEQALTQQRNELSLLKDKLAQQNRELEIANGELQRLDSLRARFVSVAAHELRTPLASIYGYLEVILDGDLGQVPENQREYLNIMQESASRLLTISNNLLDVTRIDAERVELFLEPVDLKSLLQKVIKELEPQLKAKDQTLLFESEANIPDGFCDKIRVMQIANNLINNANKYTPESGTISVRLARVAENGFVALSVSDNGPGISVADQEKLFSVFYRAESVANGQESGAGLGLYIIRSLVDLHGGQVWLDSTLGQGTTFYATLPTVDE